MSLLLICENYLMPDVAEGRMPSVVWVFFDVSLYGCPIPEHRTVCKTTAWSFTMRLVFKLHHVVNALIS